MTLPLTKLAQHATVRLIPTRHHSDPVLKPLVDSDEERAALEELEGLTSGRLRAQQRGLKDLDPRELAYLSRARQLQTYGATYINAAFSYPRQPPGNRFNSASRGAWYCAFEDNTAIEEVGYHKTRELRFIGVFEDETVYQSYLADFIGEFPDLRSAAPPPPDVLDPDPAVGYPAGQRLAEELRDGGHTGIIYPSVRAPGGTCFAAFVPQIVQNVRPGAKWSFRWTGSPDFTVTAR